MESAGADRVKSEQVGPATASVKCFYPHQARVGNAGLGCTGVTDGCTLKSRPSLGPALCHTFVHQEMRSRQIKCGKNGSTGYTGVKHHLLKVTISYIALEHRR